MPTPYYEVYSINNTNQTVQFTYTGISFANREDVVETIENGIPGFEGANLTILEVFKSN